MKKLISFLLVITSCLCLVGCDSVQIFKKAEKLEYKEVKEGQLVQDVYYVKTGTNFAPVYMPKTSNFSGVSKKIDQKRILWIKNDDFMIPEHYFGELVAYASAKNMLSNVVLERFEDMGYSIGVYGGTIDENGYYCFSVKENTIPGSEASEYFSNTPSDSIRITSIGNASPENIIDKGSGIIKNLKEGESYVIEFYSGTYFYRAAFTADTHLFRPFELYTYGKEQISDTTHGYQSFNTPQDLKSGYYLVNGTGFFKYHSYTKGEIIEDESYNIGYYSNLEEAKASYTQQYAISVPQTTKNMIITVDYGEAKDLFDASSVAEAYLTAPDGSEYLLDVDTKNKQMKITLEIAQAGDWTINILPKSLEVSSVDVKSDDIFEDTTCYEQEFVIDNDRTFQMFYADVEGDVEAEVRGTIIDSEGITYMLSPGTYKDKNRNNKKYLLCKMPYMKAGTYTVKIYYYKSRNSINNLHIEQYDDNQSDVFIIENDGQVYEAENKDE